MALDQIDEVAAQLTTAVVSDILDRLGYFDQVVHAGIQPIAPSMKVIGYARTARVAEVNERPARPYALLLDSIDSLTRNDVLVLACQGRQTSALFGGLLATAVSKTGARGVVLDGMTRDTEELSRIGLSTFAAGRTPLDSFGRDEVVEINTPVVLGDVLISPGDLVISDADGTVVVPAAVAEEVVKAALEKLADEGEMRRALRDGMPTATAFEEFGIL